LKWAPAQAAEFFGQAAGRFAKVGSVNAPTLRSQLRQQMQSKGSGSDSSKGSCSGSSSQKRPSGGSSSSSSRRSGGRGGSSSSGSDPAALIEHSP